MSKTKIDKLTPEQTLMMAEYTTEWIAKGINTDRIDPVEALDIIHALQEHILKTPTTPVVIFDNPIEAWIACNYSITGTAPNDLKGKVDEFFAGKTIKLQGFTLPYLGGSFDAPIWAFYYFFKDKVGVDFGEALKFYNIWYATHKLGMIFPLPTVCIVSEKPTKVLLNDARVAHCDGSTAIEYAGRGDLKIYMLNGVTVPDWLALEHSTKIDLELYKTITNADVKMEFVRKVGIERMLEFGKQLDSYANYQDEWWTKSQYELWDMEALFDTIPYAPHLKMLNQTTGVWHIEAVSPDCKTLAEALFERFGDMVVDIQSIS